MPEGGPGPLNARGKKDHSGATPEGSAPTELNTSSKL